MIERLQQPTFERQLLVTGSHLDDCFGRTVDAIDANGFHIDVRVPLSRAGDGAQGTAAGLADAITGITTALHELRPDILLILGDRFEIFAAAQAALIAHVPVAHIAGGDISEGAYDDAMRHAITKLSHLHFTTHADARRRVLQLGEADDKVFLTGSPGIDALLDTPRWDKDRLQTVLGFRLRARNLAVTFHPTTLDIAAPREQIAPLLDALARHDESTGIIFTGTNADDGGLAIAGAVKGFVAGKDNACFVQSLGQAGYYTLVEQADAVVGNSSSGLYEAPSLRTPTLDIGIRQQGRLRGPSVVHVDNNSRTIGEALDSLLDTPPTDFHNPYGDGSASEQIVAALAAVDDPMHLLIKHFVERTG